MLVDIHCHLLPHRDDGAQSQEMAIAMARQAVHEGISHILCTPHYNNGRYVNTKQNIIPAVASFQRVLDQEKIPLTLLEGQEVRLTADVMTRITRGDILFTDLADTYILIEFPFSDIPFYAKPILWDMISLGYRPIIVHPERHSCFMKDPNLLVPFIEIGCISQVTAGSYLGHFGKKSQRAAHVMVEHHMAHLMASDAHDTTRRGFHLKEAYDMLERKSGQKTRVAFEQAAKDVINGDTISCLSVKHSKNKFKWF